MTPFSFGTNKDRNREELTRFEAAAAQWKPAGLAQEYATRLDFYLWRQRAHVERTIRDRYKRTADDVLPFLEALRLTRFFVDETAKVFLSGHGLELASDGEPLDAESDEAKRWADVQDEMALGLKLKLVDRYTTLDRTCFLRIDREDGGPMSAQVFLPDNVDVVPDPAFPFDLDRAHGVRLRIGGGDEEPDEKGEKRSAGRYEFWCARPGEEQYRVISGDGTLEEVPGNETGALPYLNERGRGVLPVVMFTLHAEELGLFTNEGQGLHQANLAADVTATDIGYIAASQGFGQLTIAYPEGRGGENQEHVIGPTRALVLKDGAQAEILSPSPQIGALLELLDKKIRRAASLAGIPPGSVSLEGRQVPSGIALQIEMRPLMEMRTDAIDFYRAPMKRLWRVIRTVHDARRADGEPELGSVEGRWSPADVQLPESETELIDRLTLEKRQGWRSDAEAVAKIRRVSQDEAEKILAQIEEVTPRAETPAEDDPLGIAAKRRALEGGGEEEEDEGDDPEEEQETPE